MAEAYKEGLLDPDFITLKAEDSQAPFDTQGLLPATLTRHRLRRFILILSTGLKLI